MAQVIQGQIAPEFLEKSTRYFNHDSRTIMAELLQNSRRARAGKVVVSERPMSTKKGVMVTYRDDGHGITDFQALVSLGRSDWTGGVKEGEDPAGAGVFCLFGAGAVITSGTQRVKLTKDLFRGVPQEVEEISTPVKGVEIKFGLAFPKEQVMDKALPSSKDALVTLGSHMDMDIVFQDKPVWKIPYRTTHRHCRHFPEKGYSLYLCDRETLNSDYSSYDDEDFHYPRNIYGSYRESNCQILFGGIPVTKSPSCFRRTVSAFFSSCILIVDIHDTRTLTPSLPDRGCLLEGQGYEEGLATAANDINRFIWQAASALYHISTEVPYDMWKEAADAGFDIPLPNFKVAAPYIWTEEYYQPKSREIPSTYTDAQFLRSCAEERLLAMHPHLENTGCSALAEFGNVVSLDKRLAKYPQLVEKMSICTDGWQVVERTAEGDKILIGESIHEDISDEQDEVYGMADCCEGICVHGSLFIQLLRGREVTAEKSVEYAVCCTHKWSYGEDDYTILLDKANLGDLSFPENVAEAATETFWTYNEEGDSDSSDTQLKDAKDDLITSIQGLLQKTDAQKLALRIQKILSEHFWYPKSQLKLGTEITLKLTGDIRSKSYCHPSLVVAGVQEPKIKHRVVRAKPFFN